MSLFENDYIKRLVKQVAELAERLGGLRQEQRIDDALEEMRDAYGRILATDAEMLHLLDAASAARMLRDAATMKTYADLLCEEAKLHDLAGNTSRALARRSRALAIFEQARDASVKRDPAIDVAIAMLRASVQAS